MTDTGWKNPTMVAQDSRRELNNDHDCYPFKNLDNIKKDDNKTFADQRPWPTTGIDSDHKSPMIYAYNYGFNIPSKAIVTKITLFVLVQQVTHPKYYYEHYVLKRQLRFSTSKFCHVKLKTGASLVDGGVGNDMSQKCKVPMLPYQQWSTEETTTFSGSPADWGLTSTNIPAIINSGNFGVVLQFVGTIKNGWCTPGVAQVRLKVEYSMPGTATVDEYGESVFSKLTVTCGGKTVEFDGNRRSTVSLGDLTIGDYDNPVLFEFNYSHKGRAAQTPVMVLKSPSLVMGSNAKAYKDQSAVAWRFTVPSLHCNNDKVIKVYSQTVAVFPGTLVGYQSITYVWEGKTYTLIFNVVNAELTDAERARFMNEDLQCMIVNCLFENNKAVNQGGANYITSEFYHRKDNIYGICDKSQNIEKCNVAHIKNSPCHNTYFRGVCEKK